MYYTFYQETNKIELVLSDKLTKSELLQITHQLESLSTMYNGINVLIDAGNLSAYDITTGMDELNMLRHNLNRIERIAIVSDDKFYQFITKILGKLTDTEIRSFPVKEVEKGRNWIFPSRLPA